MVNRIRQQAGSYGRHFPPMRHSPQIPFTRAYPVDTSSAGDPVYTRAPHRYVIRRRARVRTRTPSIRHPPQISCRSALAREGVGSGDVKGAGRLCSPAITPKTACTQGSWFRPSTDSQSPPAPAAPDAVRPPAPPDPRPLVHPPSHGCGSGTSRYSTDRPAC